MAKHKVSTNASLVDQINNAIGLGSIFIFIAISFSIIIYILYIKKIIDEMAIPIITLSLITTMYIIYYLLSKKRDIKTNKILSQENTNYSQLESLKSRSINQSQKAENKNKKVDNSTKNKSYNNNLKELPKTNSDKNNKNKSYKRLPARNSQPSNETNSNQYKEDKKETQNTINRNQPHRAQKEWKQTQEEEEEIKTTRDIQFSPPRYSHDSSSSDDFLRETNDNVTTFRKSEIELPTIEPVYPKRDKTEPKNKPNNSQANVEMKVLHKNKQRSISAKPTTSRNFLSKKPEEGNDMYIKTRETKPSKQQPLYTSQPKSNGDNYYPPSNKNFKRIQIFNENQEIVKNGFYKYYRKDKNDYVNKDIKDDLKYSIDNTETIPSNSQLHFNQKLQGKPDEYRIYQKIEVCKESTFSAAIQMKKISRKVCVLNFASATKPGGGVKNGRNAQEECLSRQSTLFFSLETQKEFYEYNKKVDNPYGTDYMIYSPNVLIIRDDDDNLVNAVKVSVISSVAVDCSRLPEDQKDENKIYSIMKNRCSRILKLCLNKGNDIIVLGAFGCGVFQNSPVMISQIFKEILIKEGLGAEFNKVIFAIKTKPDQTSELFDSFKKTLTYHSKLS